MKKKEATNETQPPILTKPRRRKLHCFCIVAAAKASSFLHRRGSESFIIFASSWRRKLHRFCIVAAAILTKPRRLKLHRFCIVAAARHVRSLRFASPEAFASWVWSESAPGFSFVASFFFVLNSPLLLSSSFCLHY